jgi:hypothetical protein
MNNWTETMMGEVFFTQGITSLDRKLMVALPAEFDGMILHIQRELHLPLVLQSATVNDPVAVSLPSSFINEIGIEQMAMA